MVIHLNPDPSLCMLNAFLWKTAVRAYFLLLAQQCYCQRTATPVAAVESANLCNRSIKF